VPRASFTEPIVRPGLGRGSVRTYGDAAERKIVSDAIAVLKAHGATVVDPADIPSIVDPDPSRNLLLWSNCSGAGNAKGKDEGCSVVMKYGMKRDFNRWLESLGPTAPVKSLTELRQWNAAHERAGAIKYGQSQLDISDEMDVDADRPRYEADRRKDLLLGGEHGIDEVMKKERLDALMFPGSGGATVASRPGYPTVIVPFGLVANAPNPPFPPGFDAKPEPFGVGFTGTACSEPRLIEIAYAFEQATKRRIPPPGAP
jgi:amidase